MYCTECGTKCEDRLDHAFAPQYKCPSRDCAARFVYDGEQGIYYLLNPEQEVFVDAKPN